MIVLTQYEKICYNVDVRSLKTVTKVPREDCPLFQFFLMNLITIYLMKNGI